MKLPHEFWVVMLYVCFPVVLIRQILIDEKVIHARHDWLEFCYKCGSYVQKRS